MNGRSLIAGGVLSILAGTAPGISPAAGSSGTFTFHASISGRAHDAGTIKASEHASSVFDQTGCAIIKQHGSGKTLRGAYNFVVRFIGKNPVIEPGIKPAGPWVLLEVDHFRSGVTSYSKLDVSGSFTTNGRTYGGGGSAATVVRMRNGGRDGAWTSSDATRSYPSILSGLKLVASWHCSTIFHLTQQP
jgi:hypothetical protein